ncbi:MAG TPA: hypothetical protein VIR57_15145 [Chloroflexota bacterium]|jgi:hypothetical protein
MAFAGDRSIRDIIDDMEALSRTVIQQVVARAAPRAIEEAVLRGLDLSTEAAQHLSLQLDSAQRGRHDEVSYLSEALEVADQKLAFFLGSTMRRSVAAQLRGRDDAEAHAEQAERVAAEACATHALDRLVEAYKALEGLEARIVELRGTIKSGGSGPEPRVLDLPRARVLAARRSVGAAVIELDSEDDFT